VDHVGSGVRIPLASLQAYEQLQLEQRRPPVHEDDIEALFPIRAPDEIRARKAVDTRPAPPPVGEAA
jgi:hypothetical protein